MTSLFTEPETAAPPAATSGKIVEFFVPGIPRPGGSKTATLIRRKGGEIVMKNGRPLITTRDDAKGNAEWKQNVAFFARQHYNADPQAVALRIRVVFVMPRPKYHYGTGKNAGILKPDAPALHTVKPDGTKLMRSTEDALTGILWIDDAIIADQGARKVYGSKPGAFIVLERAVG
jgi:Holliday junction resolvase RusA-like endonuclease